MSPSASMPHESFDYIVVGAGSAGCAVAARLTEDGSRRVLLIEGGGKDDHVWIHVPLGVGKLLTNERYAWKFETEPQAGMKGQRIYWPRGKVLGGSSALNGMAYVWGDPREYDSWAALGIQGWSAADVQPYFRRLETNPYSSRADRGHDGPVFITDRQVRERDAISDAFVAGAQQAGIAPTPDYNAGPYEGVRYLEQTARHGRRWSAAMAYLRPARGRPNLVIRTGARATRILIEQGRAVGVEYLERNGKRQARAACEVVLCAGAIQSPQLLELSGIGDGARLRRLGIAVVRDLPAVGEHMSDHLQVRRTYRTHLPITINDLMNSRWRGLLAGMQYLLRRKGLLAGTSSTAHAITRTRPDCPRPDVMVRVYHISGKDRYSRSKVAGIDPFSGFSVGGFVLYPESRGSVHCAVPDPLAAPSIQPNYLSREADRRATVDLLKLIGRIAAQPAMARVIHSEQRPGDVDDDTALLDYARESGQTAWHTVGTCRMGLPGESVVDSRLRVHGIAGLRVADASVMPTIASSNTNAPAMMIGERAADMLIADARTAGA